MFDLATATLANSRTRVLINVSHPSLGTCSHYQIHQYWILKEEKWLNGVQSYISYNKRSNEKKWKRAAVITVREEKWYNDADT